MEIGYGSCRTDRQLLGWIEETKTADVCAAFLQVLTGLDNDGSYWYDGLASSY
jgi:hypothetical protein